LALISSANCACSTSRIFLCAGYLFNVIGSNGKLVLDSPLIPIIKFCISFSTVSKELLLLTMILAFPRLEGQFSFLNILLML
jgi:hypothetical protein